MPVIRVFIDDHCLGCRQSALLVDHLLKRYPGLDVAMVDVDDAEVVPESLFALPTWYVDARVWKLGNPSWSELKALIDADAR
ncbi:MAG: hypothetical protein ACOC9Y_10215 [Chloroflexota bacterium]